MAEIPAIFLSFQGKLLVSCQASEGDAFFGPENMARFAVAAHNGGAAGIRAEGVEDVRAIRAAVDIPIIGIKKSYASDRRILITPTFEDAEDLVAAGADMIALDCTSRGREYGALQRLAAIRSKLKVPVLADIATVEEAVAAEKAGADAVLSTMRGYTEDTAHLGEFDPDFIRKLTSAIKIPVIAEGRIWTPDEAKSAMAAGSYAVIVGTAITRPHSITRRFADAVESAVKRGESGYYIGVDIGGTNIKSGIVSQHGELVFSSVTPTPKVGAAHVVHELVGEIRKSILEAEQNDFKLLGIGVATAGWIDPISGRILFGTGNIPGWTGTDLGSELRKEFSLPIMFENDANAAAIGEHQFGSAGGVDNFVCITLGTGLGCGIFVNGRLCRGAHSLANELGHIQIKKNGLQCTCGKFGCLEVYTNAAALVREAGGGFASAKDVIEAAALGNTTARNGIEQFSDSLATGCAAVIEILDPSLLLICGGVTENNPLLLSALRENINERLLAMDHRRLRVEFSTQQYYGGVIGAAAAAQEN